jgi:hypothetical protein
VQPAVHHISHIPAPYLPHISPADQVMCSPPSTGSVTPVIGVRVRVRGRGRVGVTRVRAGARDRARGLTRVRVRAARLL